MLIFCAEIATLYTKLSTYIDKICPYDYYKSSVFSQKYHKMDKKEIFSQIILICENISFLPNSIWRRLDEHTSLPAQ